MCVCSVMLLLWLQVVNIATQLTVQQMRRRRYTRHVRQQRSHSHVRLSHGGILEQTFCIQLSNKFCARALPMPHDQLQP